MSKIERVSPVRPSIRKSVSEMLKDIDDALKSESDSLSVHWGFYSQAEHRQIKTPWPDEVSVMVSTGPNEGWMVEIWSRKNKTGASFQFCPQDLLGVSKTIGSREDAFEYAKLVSIAAGV